MHSKEILFDSHETYQSGTDRNHAVYNLNESIYADNLYIKRISFLNTIPNILDDITLKVSNIYWENSVVNSLINKEIILKKNSNLSLPYLINTINATLKNIENEVEANANVNYEGISFRFSANYRNGIGRIGYLIKNTGNTVKGVTHYPSISFNCENSINGKIALNELREMFGVEYSDGIQFTLVSTFQNPAISQVGSRGTNIPANHNLSEDDSDAFTYEIEYTFNEFLPKYLFLHSNISQYFKSSNQLKIGKRQTTQQNDVIAVIPIESGYGTRIVYENTEDYNQSNSIQMMNQTDINNVEFWFTKRLKTNSNDSTYPTETKIDFGGRTFQITIKYYTNQH